jgi:phytoene dehydrogenase-like protein
LSAEFDFVVIGGGTNGLCAAAYLGKNGFITLTLEQAAEVGGCAITRELTLPGFKHDVFATSLNLFKAGPVQRDLELDRYGFREVLPDPVAAHPFPGRHAIYIYRDVAQTVRSIEPFSKKDAKRFREIYQLYAESREILLGGLYAAPPRLSAMLALMEQSEEGLEFLRLTFLSIRDFLEENFESEEVRAWLAVWGSNHVPLAPEDGGSTLFLLTFLGILQDFGCGVPLGGMGALSEALARFVRAHQGIIRTQAKVTQLEVKDGRATGVRLASGEVVRAKHAVLASIEPKTLFLQLVGEENLDAAFIKKVRRFRFSRVSQVMIHAALDAWLDYRPEPVQRAGIVQLGPTLASVSRAYNHCVNDEPPAAPFMTIDNTTGYDPSRAPSGKHTMWNFVRAPATLAHGDWADAKEAFADRCFDVLAEYAPNVRRIVLKRITLSPPDLEALNPNIANADPGVGKATLDQALALRPFPGWSSYRTPIQGLYMCGSYTHPGGGVSGAPGYNAVTTALADLKERVSV